jgi:cephalosporin hydroxylase
MKITIDTVAKTLDVAWARQDAAGYTLPLYSKDAFELLTEHWLKVGWNERYPYTFTWLGLPILQIPEDMVRMQEVLFQLQPDLIIETGVAHGGSMLFYASLCELYGRGLVVGIERGLRCRREIENHYAWLRDRITLIEGDSTSAAVVERVHRMAEGKRVLVILDSDHSKAHVARELELYHDLIQPGSYIVAADGNMGDLADVPRGSPAWKLEFHVEQPAWPFNDSALTKNVTYWKSAWLKRRFVQVGVDSLTLEAQHVQTA